MHLLRVDYKTAKKIASGIEVKGGFELKIVGKLELPPGVGDFEPQHKEYIKHERKMKPKYLKQFWGVRGIGINGGPRYSWRLFVPTMYRGKVVSWSTRSIVPKAATRWLGAPAEQESISKSDLCYGIDHCRDAAIAVEGQPDVWAGGPGFVSTLGSGFSDAQVAQLGQFPVRAVWFDDDESGRKKGKQLCQLLEPFPGETYQIEVAGCDPATAPKKLLKRIRKKILGVIK